MAALRPFWLIFCYLFENTNTMLFTSAVRMRL